MLYTELAVTLAAGFSRSPCASIRSRRAALDGTTGSGVEPAGDRSGFFRDAGMRRKCPPPAAFLLRYTRPHETPRPADSPDRLGRTGSDQHADREGTSRWLGAAV